MKKKILLLSFLAFGISISSVAQNQTNVQNTYNQNDNWRPKVILTASRGVGFKLAKTATGLTPELKSVVSDLKSGFTIDLGAFVVLRNRQSGVGFKYNRFISNGSSITYNIDEQITFIGPAYVLCPEGGATGQANLEIAAGYMGFKQNWQIANEVPFELTGSAFGLSSAGGYHFKINKRILLGPQLTIFVGSIRKFDQAFADGRKATLTLEQDQAEGLTRIDLSVSLKIRL